MAKKEKTVILTEDSCEGCQVIKERLAGKAHVRIIDIKDPEAKQYIKEDQVIVPSAVHQGKRCLIRLEDNKLKMDCEDGETVNLED